MFKLGLAPEAIFVGPPLQYLNQNCPTMSAQMGGEIDAPRGIRILYNNRVSLVRSVGRTSRLGDGPGQWGRSGWCRTDASRSVAV
jgi:hypothetical protein